MQLSNLQIDYDNLGSRLEEEMDVAVDLRNQLLRSQNEYQSLKSKYDKEIIIVTEEMEESRSGPVYTLHSLQLYMIYLFTFYTFLCLFLALGTNSRDKIMEWVLIFGGQLILVVFVYPLRLWKTYAFILGRWSP